MPNQLRHFLDLHLQEAETLSRIIDFALKMKKEFKSGTDHSNLLPNKQLGMIFEKNSTRTRVSFEVGMRHLGGDALYLSRSDLQLGRGETIGDTAKVLSRYLDIIMLRSMYHETLVELAENATVPVINGLTNKSHPCQVMADVMTYIEHRGSIKGKTFAWIGDANNVSASMIHAAEKFDFKLNIACPKKYQPSQDMLNANVKVTDNPYDAVDSVDCVMTDAWVSMGDEEPELKKRTFQRYRVSEEVMKFAAKDALFMHCLPAYRGEEVTSEVIDGSQSVVLDEAENRLHVQKAIILWCLGKY